MSKEAMKLALEALERNDYLGYQANQKAITALRQAIAEAEKQEPVVCLEIHDAIVRDSDKAFALLRWAETEMRYAGWSKRKEDQHGQTDVYEAVVEFLK